jgi:hypothetical protein
LIQHAREITAIMMLKQKPKVYINVVSDVV